MIVNINNVNKKNTMKVLHIDTEKGWRGGQQQAVYLHENLLKRNIHTDFVCRPDTELSNYLKKNDLPFYEINMRNEMDFFSAYKIAKITKQEKINILHLHSAHALSIGILTRLFNKNLKLICVRRVDFSTNKNLISKKKYDNPYVDRIVCISDAIRKVLLKDGIKKEKLITIHSGIDLHKFDSVEINEEYKKSLGIEKEKIVVGTIAALVGHKDYPNLLKAAQIVIDKTGNVIFLAAGGGKDEEQILKLAENSDLKNRFKFLGYRKDIGKLLKSFDIFVLASKKEGLGTSILDAQAVGLPVIGTDAGGIPEAIENNKNGILVPSQNPQKLAEAIVTLARNKETRTRFGKYAQEFVQKFSIQNTIEKNIKLYETLL